MTGKITEIFESIQGEGVYFGKKQVFVRFAQCNLQCSYCDTEFNHFREYGVDELLSAIASYEGNYHSISFTGGEPLLQKDFLRENLLLLKQAGNKTYLETNGTLPEALDEVIEFVDIIAMDIKLPSSGKSSGVYWDEHRRFLKTASQKEVFIKAVISTATTEEDCKVMLDLLNGEKYLGVLVLQPNSLEDGRQLEEKLTLFKNWGAHYPFSVCVMPQMHKLWGVR
ncbi:MAG: hypothetical protein A2Y00_02245 [Omnitrophica WOR_2 bacterium GWF2_43_52]|nr:MAG: hypothetical protein A2Y01_04035 [Omnitrophica WOR_2 bacterium GWC2_44_8]OGX22167.1 MAG: hypothetical protein A2Y00_02245 [Omnitrophica WOR_2 bacterium GWF2_43_52]HAH20640.1 7-carboxy-7-deazaguanine synthase QueE [Candidatus Omnitrophota bacterium]HBG63558.1 7-carboxy-7-deazaguanine synthase QueE [Candidatus Omnitrophota bacterium]HCD38906.1 7-carboxy-7-deazaguanine synthase QueE [Candidatus Omnitrophota bacterium]